MAEPPQPPDLDVDIPCPSGLFVTTDQKYYILVVNDFAGGESGSLSGPLSERVVEVNANNFDEVMASASPAISYATKDPVGSGGAMIEVKLRFDSLKAFNPQNLIGQIPPARALLEVRGRIVERMRGKMSSDELGGAVGRAASADAALSWLPDAIRFTPAEPAADPGTVDAMLDQIDLGGEEGGEAKPPGKSPMGKLVSAAAGVGGGVPAEEATALRHALTEIDKRVSAWLTHVLHSPQVQNTESAWRSLAFLVSRIDFRKGLRLSVLHARRAEVCDRFRTLLIDPVFDEGADAPHLVAVDMEFSNGAPDVAILDEMAQHGASLPAMVVAGLAASFFGVKHAWQIPTLPAMVNMFDTWQFAKWKALRAQPYARNLAGVFGRCLLRGPHGGDGEGKAADLAFQYREKCLGEKDLVWATGAVAAACTTAKSVADTGWPCGMAGYVHGRIEGLPIIQAGPKGDKTFGPADTRTPQPRIEEMGMAGINAVVGLADSDDAIVWNGLTLARPDRAEPSALLEVSLPYHLFAGRLSSLLWDLKSHLAGMSADKMTATVTAHVRNWLGTEGVAGDENVTVQVRPAEDDPSALELAVTVKPPQAILPASIPVVLGYKIAK
ncbi:MAG TPA: type VI secretion system contractile sheath large subunit [Phycisphaerae bacterium]|nr:type VI secretion system contractile sheath large subunit [Phycisphaerae bacterium]